MDLFLGIYFKQCQGLPNMRASRNEIFKTYIIMKKYINQNKLGY